MPRFQVQQLGEWWGSLQEEQLVRQDDEVISLDPLGLEEPLEPPEWRQRLEGVSEAVQLDILAQGEKLVKGKGKDCCWMLQRTLRGFRPRHRVISAQDRSIPALRILYQFGHFHCQAQGSALEAGHWGWRWRAKHKPVTRIH